MIYLIGGPPRCGKTTLARQLARLVQSPWLHTDYMASAFSRYFLPGAYDAQVPARDPGPEATGANNNDLLYARYTAAQTIAYYRARARQVWPGVQSFIEYALFDGEDLIIEGHHIDPALADSFAVPADTTVDSTVRRIFLVREDANGLAASLKRGGGRNDWVLKGTRQEVTFERIAQMVTLYSADIRADAESRGFPVVTTDGDFDAQLVRALDVLIP
jgi:2-phosphoglycerate kinase